MKFSTRRAIIALLLVLCIMQTLPFQACAGFSQFDQRDHAAKANANDDNIAFRNHTTKPPYRDPLRDFIMNFFTGGRSENATLDPDSQRWHIVDSIGQNVRTHMVSPLIARADRQYFGTNKHDNIIMERAPQRISLSSFFPEHIASGNIPYVQGSFPFSLIGLSGVLISLFGVVVLCMMPYIGRTAVKRITVDERSSQVPLLSSFPDVERQGHPDESESSDTEQHESMADSESRDNDTTSNREAPSETKTRTVRDKRYCMTTCFTLTWIILTSLILLTWWILDMQVNVATSEAIDEGFQTGRDVLPVIKNAMDLANVTTALGLSMTTQAKSLLFHVNDNIPSQPVLDKVNYCFVNITESKPKIDVVSEYVDDVYTQIERVPTRAEMTSYQNDLEKRLTDLVDVKIESSLKQTHYMESAATKDEALPDSVDKVASDRDNTDFSILENGVSDQMKDVVAEDTSQWLSSTTPLSTSLEPILQMLSAIGQNEDTDHTFGEMETLALDLQKSLDVLQQKLPSLIGKIGQWQSTMDLLGKDNERMLDNVKQVDDVITLRGLLELESRIEDIRKTAINDVKVKYSELQEKTRRLSSVLVSLPDLHILQTQLSRTSLFFGQFGCFNVLNKSLREINDSLVIIPDTYFDLYARVVNASDEVDPYITQASSSLDTAIQYNETHTPQMVLTLDSFSESNVSAIIPDFLTQKNHVHETITTLEKQLKEKDPRRFMWKDVRSQLLKFGGTVQAVTLSELRTTLEQLQNAASEFDNSHVNTFLKALRSQEGFDPAGHCQGTCPDPALRAARDTLLSDLNAFIEGQEDHIFDLRGHISTINVSLPVLKNESWHETSPDIRTQMTLIQYDFDTVEKAMQSLSSTLIYLRQSIQDAGQEALQNLNTTTEMGFNYFEMIPERSLIDNILDQIRPILSSISLDTPLAVLDMISDMKLQTESFSYLIDSMFGSLFYANEVIESYYPMLDWADKSLHATQAAVTSIDTARLVFGIFLFAAFPIPVPIAFVLIALLKKNAIPFWLLAFLYLAVAAAFFLFVSVMIPLSVMIQENCPIASDIISDGVSSLVTSDPIDTNYSIVAGSVVELKIDAAGIARSTLKGECNSTYISDFAYSLDSGKAAVVNLANFMTESVDAVQLPFSLKLHPSLIDMVHGLAYGVHRVPSIIDRGSSALGCPVLSTKWGNAHQFVCHPVQNIVTSSWFYILLLAIIFLENGIFFTVIYAYVTDWKPRSSKERTEDERN